MDHRHVLMTALISLATLAAGVGGFSVVATAPGCSSDDDGGEKCVIAPTLDRAVCALTNTFSTTIDNPYFPLTPGKVMTYRGVEDGAEIVLVITVTSTTELVGGVTTVVVTEEETEDGELIEVSQNYFAQAADGTVCYFGETTDNYEDGVIVNHDGAWRADEGSNAAGIIMPANPAVGDAYEQEHAPDIARDRAQVVASGDAVSVPYGDFTATISTDECTPLEADSYETKHYASGVGLIVDDVLKLESVTP